MKNFIAPRSLRGTLSLPKCLPKGRLITICLLAAFFALSACDDSSSASSDETGVSSSSVESPDSSVTLSGASAESNGSSNETKDKSSSSENKSSSSTKETKVSSDSKSSSSVKSDDSSSSNKDKSSSSVSSSSSEKQSSSSVKSSSSSVKQSSSSVASSSSFVRWGDLPPNFSYGEFEYEQRIYKYLTVTGKDTNNKTATIDVMAENLNVGIMIDGSENQSDNSKVERYCYDNDTTKCLNYGGLYQWAEMMNLPFECNSKSCADSIKPNHQGICPDGWRLMTYNDFYIVVHADGNDAGVEGVRSTGFGGLNYTGYSLIGAGYFYKGIFNDLGETAYWFYPEEISATDGFTNWSSKITASLSSTYHTPKSAGESVRCAKINK